MIKKKNIIISVLTAMLIVTLAVMCFYANTMGAKLQVNVRNVELNAIELDYSSIINQFENAKVTKEGSVTTFEGYQTLDASLFEGLDNVSESDIESSVGCQIKYNFTYDSEANIVTLSALMENGEKLEIEEIYGSAFIDENGRLDAVMDFDGEYVLLSEMQDMGLIQNCGWFSRLFKKVVKAVVAVAAVAVCVATAGAGVAAVIAIGAAVGAAESVATQLLETGKVSLGAVLVDTALGAIPGGTGAKTVAKESIKAGAEIAAKKAAKEAAEKVVKNVASKYTNSFNKDLVQYLKNEKLTPEQISKRLKNYPAPKNEKWNFVDEYGNKVLDKNELAKKGGNGTIKSASTGEEVADVISGGLVFRENVTSAVVRTSKEIVDNPSGNFKIFNELLWDQVTDKRINNAMVNKIRDYFKKKGMDIENIKVRDIEKYRTDNKLTWHECTDKRTAQLVPQEIHSTVKGGIPHSGGRAEVR